MFYATAGITSLIFVLLTYNFLTGNSYVLSKIGLTVVGLSYLLIVRVVIAKKRYTTAAWMMFAQYTVSLITILLSSSITTQSVIFMLGFLTILTGAIIGIRYILPVTIGSILALGSLQIAGSIGFVDTSGSTVLSRTSTFVDIISYIIVFVILALVSWLSRRQMEQSLQRALAAEAELAHEKKHLAIRLEERTRDLRAVQLKEMQQMYRFAELGQMSTAVLHELANHLTVLTLDIDDIEQRSNSTESIAHAKESIGYLDAMVNQMRKQIHENNERTNFTVFDMIDEIAKSLKTKATKSRIAVTLTKKGNKKDSIVNGDPLRLAQIITVLATNAIDAYTEMEKMPYGASIDISATIHASKVVISFTDYGVGISDLHRTQLFEPFQSTKENGIGVGLFIAKKMIETHFKGKIWIDPRQDATEFVIQLPRVQAVKITK